MLISFPLDQARDMFAGASSDDELLRAIRDYYAYGPHRPEVSLTAGWITVRIDVERIDASEKDYRKVVQLAERQRYSEAKPLLRRLIERSPQVSEYHRILGQILFEEGDVPGAKDEFIDAIRWDPENQGALVMLGNVYARLRERETAIRFYERALALDADNYIALTNVAANLAEQGDLAGARTRFERAASLAPEYPNVHLGLTLLARREGRTLDAFGHALRAAAAAGGDVRLRDHAVQSAVALARQHAEEENQEALFTPRLRELERRCGRRIEIEREETLPTAARIEVAEYRDRDAHVLRYQTRSPAYGHLVLHELEHLELIAEAREAGKNRVFTSTPEHRTTFLRAFQPATDKLIRSGIPPADAEAVAASIFEGLNAQAYNAPVDLLIESRLHARLPELRPLQFLSLYEFVQDGIRAATSPTVRDMSPAFVRDANTIYNLTQAKLFEELYGIDFLPAFNAPSVAGQAGRLYREFLQERDGHTPGGEYDLVARWARALKLDGYFALIPEAELRRASYVPAGAALPPRGDRAVPIPPTGALDARVIDIVTDALDYYEGQDRAQVQAVAFEVAMVGMQGIVRDDPEPRYTLRSIPGNFTGLQLMVMMYVGFKILEPGLNTELDFHAEYAEALRRRADA